MLRFAIAAFVAAGLCLAAPVSADTFKPFSLKTTDGEKKTLADVAGKVTLVVFFFPTCKYCNASFPEVAKLVEKYKDRDLAAVWINCVPREDRLVKEWVEKRGNSVTALVGASDAVLNRNYGLSMTPTHYLLDASGTVLFKQSGFQPGDDALLDAQIQKALEPR